MRFSVPNKKKISGHEVVVIVRQCVSFTVHRTWSIRLVNKVLLVSAVRLSDFSRVVFFSGWMNTDDGYPLLIIYNDWVLCFFCKDIKGVLYSVYWTTQILVTLVLFLKSVFEIKTKKTNPIQILYIYIYFFFFDEFNTFVFIFMVQMKKKKTRKNFLKLAFAFLFFFFFVCCKHKTFLNFAHIYTLVYMCYKKNRAVVSHPLMFFSLSLSLMFSLLLGEKGGKAGKRGKGAKGKKKKKKPTFLRNDRLCGHRNTLMNFLISWRH